ncbi:MAG: M18 family aminopeptidase [Rubrivivax sp.]|nr:M18 family aminopeptidase [Rubrivivax sp.]
MPKETSAPAAAAAARGEYIEHFRQFLSASPTPFHAVREMARQLDAAGFEALAEAAAWGLRPGGRYYTTRNGSALVAFVVGADPVAQGLRMFGAHTDSPCLKVKPQPELRQHGCLQLGVEVYGGALLNPWFDRDLGLAGRVTYETGAGGIASTLLDFARPVATIPSLAIHLDREVNEKRSINPQHDLPLVVQLDDEEEEGGKAWSFRQLLEQELRRQQPALDLRRVLDYEMSCYDTQAPAVTGMAGDFIAGGRLDNLLSCFVGLQALKAADGSATALLVCNDHEEVGSGSAAGAQGPMLHAALQRLLGDAESYARAIDRSLFISADNAHALHPNFPHRHDGRHGPRINRGPVIKINANQRYASTSETSALFRRLCELEGVPVQSFVVRSDMGCGSTIGPITASVIGVKVLDVGVPQWAMHSIRELAGTHDAWALFRVAARFFNVAALDGPLQ